MNKSLQKKIMELPDVFKALSNANRLMVFEIIRRGHGGAAGCKNENRPDSIPAQAVCVCEILEQLDVTAPTLSHHLKELRNARLVNVYHCGQWSYYSVREEIMKTLAEYFMSGARVNKK